MEYRQLGTTGLNVSSLCLGTMTWGEQNTPDDAFAQLDMAVDYGINFIDTAELYPVPPTAETSGATETILGQWLNQKKCRDKLIIATKVAGKSDWLPYMRDGQARHDRKNIEAAIDHSLQRLQTDYIDLYQLHWPDRKTNFFGQLAFEHDPADTDWTPIEETLQVLNDLASAGKVRHIGLSNETPWGVMKFLQLAKERDWPRIVSIQNPYSLLNRTYEIGNAEISLREQAGLLAYSPLAFGVLSGKYLDGQRPAGARLSLFERFTRYSNKLGTEATRAYVSIAHRHGLDPAQMALAWVTSRPFVTSNIIGATDLDQLQSNLHSSELVLSDDLIADIEEVHTNIPNPCP